MRSSELAKRTGVSTDTLRHYERLGVLARPQRTPAGYRLYSPEAVERVELIQRALFIGFSLAELVSILRLRDRGGVPCKQVRALAEAKLKQVDFQLHGLKFMRNHLRHLIASWDERLSHTPEGERAGLLEMLSSQPRAPSHKRTKL